MGLVRRPVGNNSIFFDLQRRRERPLFLWLCQCCDKFRKQSAKSRVGPKKQPQTRWLNEKNKQTNKLKYTRRPPTKGTFSLNPRPHYAVEIWKRMFIFMFRPTVHTNLSRKRSFNFELTLFKPEEFENAALLFSVNGSILKTALFKNHGMTTIMWFWFPCLNFSQTQIQNDQWLLLFQISQG